MQFQVPQFIETEDTIAGVTFKQFIYVTIAIIIAILLYFSPLKMWLWAVISGVLILSSLVFSSLKINGRPIKTVAAAMFQFFWGPNTYKYKNKGQKTHNKFTEIKERARRLQAYTPKRANKVVGIKNLLSAIRTQSSSVIKRTPNHNTEGAPNENFGEPDKYGIIEHAGGDSEIVKRVDFD